MGQVRSRGVAGAALVVALLAVTIVVAGDESRYRVRAQFETASQLVKGNEVQVAGKRVGLVKDIRLDDQSRAEAVLEIEEEAYRPLRRGTRAIVRLTSLAGVANRYVDLHLPPDDAPDIPENGLIPAKDTVAAVDLDQLFNVFDKRTRTAFAGVVEGQARVWKGTAKEADAGLLYLNPALAATNRLLTTLNREPQPISRFLVASSRFATDLAAEREQLAPLVADARSATSAVAEQERALDDGIAQLPPTLRRANTTFVDVRTVLDDLDPLVDAAGPAARALRPFARDARTLAVRGRPALRELSRLLSAPGADNDVPELLRLLPELRDRSTKGAERNGARRPSMVEATTDALKGIVPTLAFSRPYAVDLTSWFDSFSHPGVYDATGATGRISFHTGAFQEVDGRLALVPPELRNEVAGRVLQRGQTNRCPGALERGTAYKPTPDFNCDLRQQPPGP